MSVIPGPLGAVNAAYNTLNAQLANILTEIWPLYSGITVQYGTPPSAVAIPQISPRAILRNKHLTIANYPAVMIYSASGDELQDSAPQWGTWAHVLTCEWLIAGDGEELIQAQALIYCEALWLLWERYQLLDGTLSGPHGVTADHYQALYGKTQEGKLFAGGTMRVKVIVDEGIQHS